MALPAVRDGRGPRRVRRRDGGGRVSPIAERIATGSAILGALAFLTVGAIQLGIETSARVIVVICTVALFILACYWVGDLVVSSRSKDRDADPR